MPERLHRLSISSREAIAVKKVRTSILKKPGPSVSQPLTVRS